jgi:hypothetical protein
LTALGTLARADPCTFTVAPFDLDEVDDLPLWSKRMTRIVRRVHFGCHHMPLGDHGPRASLDVLSVRLSLSGDDQPDRQANAEYDCLGLVRFSGVERCGGFAFEHFTSQPNTLSCSAKAAVKEIAATIAACLHRQSHCWQGRMN